jgi:hypothetical protein
MACLLMLATAGVPDGHTEGLLPAYVQEEFEAYLKCGRLEEGFLRVRCEQCHAEKRVSDHRATLLDELIQQRRFGVAGVTGRIEEWRCTRSPCASGNGHGGRPCNGRGRKPFQGSFRASWDHNPRWRGRFLLLHPGRAVTLAGRRLRALLG